jgi:hypothetical protein
VKSSFTPFGPFLSVNAKLPSKLFDVPELKFDGFNKLTAPVLEPTFTAARLSDWVDNNQSKTEQSGLGDWPDSTTYGKKWMAKYSKVMNLDKNVHFLKMWSLLTFRVLTSIYPLLL